MHVYEKPHAEIISFESESIMDATIGGEVSASQGAGTIPGL